MDHRGRLIGINAVMAGLEVGMAIPANIIAGFVERALAGEAGMGLPDVMTV